MTTPMQTDHPEFCPLCTRPVIEDDERGIEGVNASFCLTCSENITHYPPDRVATILGDQDFICWVYFTPSEWPLDESPVFIEGRTIARRGAPDALAFESLSEGDQQVLAAFARGDLSDIPEYEAVCRDELEAGFGDDTSYVDIVDQHHHRGPTFSHDDFPTDEIKNTLSSVPRPTIITPYDVISQSPEDVRSAFAPKRPRTTQQSLF